LEGPDGSGKSTQARLIKDSLESDGLSVELLKSPDVTLLGEFIRTNVRELEPWLRNQLFLLDIEASLKKVEGKKDCIVVWDRYVDSFYASNKEMNFEEAEALTARLPKPQKTFFLDLSSQHIFSERRETLDHHSIPEWLQQKSERYHEIIEREPERMVCIDARKPIQEITQQIVVEIKKTLGI
jgi:dTMP kinase